ncbi:MAG: hypothetical protein JNL23_07505 [Chitinophagaceae bacterium]|nr:hypothetical protein [Chitinophagaceae bacterium]
MSIEKDPVKYYQSRIKELEAVLTDLNNVKTRIAWLRFAAIVAAFLSCYLLWSSGILLAIVSFVLFFGLFLRLIILDSRNKAKIENTNTLIHINNEEIKISQHDFIHLPGGESFLPSVHAYASDLDIFGRASIYQYINRTNSEQGNKLLADWLLQPAGENEITARQEAVKELSAKTSWRQQLQAYGTKDKIKIATQQKINDWIQEENHFLDKGSWNVIRFVLPVIILIILGFYIAGIIPGPIFFGIAFIFFLIAGAISKKIMPIYDNLNKIAAQIETLSDSAAWI